MCQLFKCGTYSLNNLNQSLNHRPLSSRLLVWIPGSVAEICNCASISVYDVNKPRPCCLYITGHVTPLPVIWSNYITALTQQEQSSCSLQRLSVCVSEINIKTGATLGGVFFYLKKRKRQKSGLKLNNTLRNSSSSVYVCVWVRALRDQLSLDTLLDLDALSSCQPIHRHYSHTHTHTQERGGGVISYLCVFE